MKKFKAIYSLMGSRFRNSPERGPESVYQGPVNPKKYGFVADMRLKMRRLEKRGERFQIGTRIPVTYYGFKYTLRCCNPYIVVSDRYGSIMAIFPIVSDRALCDRFGD